MSRGEPEAKIFNRYNYENYQKAGYRNSLEPTH